jgi:putative transcriptional regulator
MFDVIKIRLDELLKREKKTLYRVAKDTGMAYTSLHAIKKGTVTDINLSTLKKLCESLNCTPNDLVGFSK